MSPHETRSAAAVVAGSCHPAFAPVRDAFDSNFRDRGELGGAVCVMVAGRVVVDLRAGGADPGSQPPVAATGRS
jgi:CubicO group peptidase (beta-lactamase class C family)